MIPNIIRHYHNIQNMIECQYSVYHSNGISRPKIFGRLIVVVNIYSDGLERLPEGVCPLKVAPPGSVVHRRHAVEIDVVDLLKSRIPKAHSSTMPAITFSCKS
jgi:hypothetical protein